MFTPRAAIDGMEPTDDTRSASPHRDVFYGGGGASLPTNQAANFQYPNQAGAATGAMGGIGNLNQNPNASYGAGAATTAGSALTGTVPQLTGYAGQALNTAFDPQQMLFNQTFAQNHQQGDVTNAQNGLAGTPYGAGLQQQNDQNFDIAWQKQQLQNQNTGANTAATLLGAGGSAATQGTAVGQSVPGFQNQQIQQAISDYLAYLQGGTGASNAANSAYATATGAALENQKLENQSTAGLGQLGGNLLGMFL